VVQGAGSTGTAVIVNGAYFGTSQGTSTVTFNGVAATPTGWSDTQIHVAVPTGSTSGPVVATVNGVASNGVTFTVDATPTITGISPGTGAAGTVVTLTGTNLGDSADYIQVSFSGATATPAIANENSLTAAVPSNALPGTVSVTVNANGYSSNGIGFTVIATPIISSLNPNSGVSGTSVSISGTNFGSSQGSSTVTFNGVPAASITSWGTTAISAVPPSNATTGPVVVVVNSISSTSTNNVFTVINPAIGSVVPPAGAPGSVVTINGSGFLRGTNQTIQVLFNGASYTPNQFTSTSVFAQVPSGASSGPVTVVVGGNSSNSVSFTVEPQLSITSVSPNAGPFASDGSLVPVTITGTGFGATQSNSTVNFFGSVLGTSIISWSDTSISVWVPLGTATGPVSVQVASVIAFAPTSFQSNAVTQLTDSLGNQSQYLFAAAGGLWFGSASQGPGCSTCTMRGTITNVPDPSGNSLSSTDALNNTTTYTYDSNNNPTSVSKPLDATHTATNTYTYNSFGEVLTSKDPLGNITTNTYDAKGNLLTVTSPAPNGTAAASVTQFQYNGLGELT
jgi:YD repeat-containing protein